MDHAGAGASPPGPREGEEFDTPMPKRARLQIEAPEPPPALELGPSPSLAASSAFRPITPAGQETSIRPKRLGSLLGGPKPLGPAVTPLAFAQHQHQQQQAMALSFMFGGGDRMGQASSPAGGQISPAMAAMWQQAYRSWLHAQLSPLIATPVPMATKGKAAAGKA